MSHDHITFFSQLQHEEKALYMSKVEKEVKNSDVYRRFSVLLRQSVDQAASQSITDEIATGKHPGDKNKAQILPVPKIRPFADLLIPTTDRRLTGQSCRCERIYATTLAPQPQISELHAQQTFPWPSAQVRSSRP